MPRPRSSSSGIPPQASFALLVVVLVVGAFLVVRAVSSPKTDNSAPVTQQRRGSPFDGLEGIGADVRGQAPEPRAGGSSTPRRPARAYEVPQALRSHADWASAEQLVREADSLRSSAEQMRAAGELAAYREAATEAAERYDQALSLTLEWRDRLAAELGEDNPEVLFLGETRAKWRKRLMAVRK